MRRIENFHGQHGGAAKGCLIAAIILIVLVGGGGYFLWTKSMGILNDELIAAVKDDAAVKEHIGDINEVGMNLMATGKHPANQNKKSDDDNAVIVFDIEGTKGTGKLIVTMNTKDSEPGEGKMFDSAYLKKGKDRYPVSLHGQPAAPLPAEVAPEKAPAESPEKAPEPAGAGAGK